jgi:hypothetical protein
MFQEVIVCDQCGAEGCTVKEIAVQPEKPKLTMTEFAKKHRDHPGKSLVAKNNKLVKARAFELQCLQCGHRHRFQPGKPKLMQPGKD